jgi:outer membrane lipoprotein-sorting protein
MIQPRKSILLLSFLATTAPCSLLAQDRSANIDVKEIVKKVDALYRSESSAGEMEMQIVTPHWERTLRMNVWTQKLDKTFIRILSPTKEKGIATLRLDNEMWNYLPNTNKVIKIPPSMMMSSWMGSDFTNDDLVNEFTLYHDYDYKLIKLPNEPAGLLFIEAKPKEGVPIVWGKVVIAIRENDYIPVWEKYYDEKDVLIRVMNFTDIKSFGSRIIPATMELIPQNKEGQKTVIRYLALEFDKKIDKEIFSLRNLQARK